MTIKTHIHILPNIHTGMVFVLESGRQIGEFTPEDAKKFADLIRETADQAERLHQDYKRRHDKTN